MASLIVSHDLRLMMLEIAVNNLFVPHTSPFDEVILKKTTVMFRMLDDDWTTLLPHRYDYQKYHGSNYENESFNGGRSVVFAVPEGTLRRPVTDVDVQLCVRKETSKYFEKDTCQTVGFALINVDNLFNGIVKELLERRELCECLSPQYLRQHISRSMRGTFSLLNEDLCLTKSTIELYIRISYFGDSLITEMESPENIRKAFYARDETGDDYIYQFRELSVEQLQSGGWDSCIFAPNPNKRDQLICNCKEFERLKKLLAGNASLLALLTGGPGEGEDDDEEAGRGLAMGEKGGTADLDKDKIKKKCESRVSQAKNALQEYLKAEAEHWKLLMEMLELAKAAPKGLSPSVGTRKGPCVSVMPCPPCQPCIPCPPCQPCPPCPPCFITSCSLCG